MLAAVLQAMLTRATIRFLLRVSSQSRPGSTSQLGCPFLSSVSRTPVPPVVGSLRLDFGQIVSNDWLPTLPKTEQLRCRTNTTSAAARGAVAWCRRACTLTVLTAKNGGQVKPKHTLVSREICKRLGLLFGFEPGGTCFQYPPVGQPGSGESEGESLTGPSGWGVQPPADCSMKSLRNTLSRRTPRGISVLRLLLCRPYGVGGTMCALWGRTLLLVQPSRSPDTAAWLTSNHNCPCHFVLGVAQPW
ncbi:hypothetical protein T4B_3858 [Trichinella pseudospiralis]|uniref:Uncharacterized protein n=1 Tax=Trichinella pseudospiralis TaxID=6337 RepID=A0A0V1H075_TRIPS|nr:hypothetical protein T4B_3858 [Trichinella pseudospiralis]